MKIVVLVKQVPDTWTARRIDPATGRIDRGGEQVLDEIGERALEIALRQKDSDKTTEVVVLTMGPPNASEALRKALTMGADSAVHITDDALVGADLLVTARVLATAIVAEDADLVICGDQSTDGSSGVLPAMIAELVGIPHATSAESVELAQDSVRVARTTEHGSAVVEAQLPALVAVTERAAEPRFPSFKGIMGARKKPTTTRTAASLGLDAAALAPGTRVVSVETAPARAAGTTIVDDGSAATELADYLLTNRLI